MWGAAGLPLEKTIIFPNNLEPSETDNLAEYAGRKLGALATCKKHEALDSLQIEPRPKVRHVEAFCVRPADITL